MKQNEQNGKTKLALAMIVKGTEEEATYLSRCLQDVSPFVDGIFITITGGDNHEAVKMVADMYNAHVSGFNWVNDFSKARNYNFSQVTEDYTHILWLDADDSMRGHENLKQTIEENPTVDGFILNYLYAFDEWGSPVIVHMKTQIIKRGAAEWVGEIHEDLQSQRSLNLKMLKGVERLHLSKPDHFDGAKQRNYDIAVKQLENNPKDPRSLWNVGNALRGLGKNEEAIEYFEKFLETSQSDDEKYIASLRLAESLWVLNKRVSAVEKTRYAIGLKPTYPDAYHLLGRIFSDMGKFGEAIEMFKAGLKLKPPYHSIIVYNPRDYDYGPMMDLARAYFNANLPTLALDCLKACLEIYPKSEHLGELIKKMESEAESFDRVLEMLNDLKKIDNKLELKAAFEKIPNKFKSHPGICKFRNEMFVKETSSGKDLAIFCGFTEETWTPETAKTKGIGGSEEAVIWLSKLLKARGWNVTVYNQCGTSVQEFDGVTWKPFWMYNPKDKQDATIFWRHPKYLDYDINSGKIYIDLHDVIPAAEFTPERTKKIDKIFVKSNFHRSLFPNIPDEKFVIIPNGIDAEKFKEESKRDPMLMINTSSADRSLSALLDCFEEIKKEVPEAKLEWAYGWGVFDIQNIGNTQAMKWKEELIERMKKLGVKELGRVSHGEVADMYLKANIFAYPSEFAEIDCISLTKAQASGAYPITTDFSALGEKQFGGTFIHSNKTKDTWCLPYQSDFALEDPEKKQEFIDACIDTLLNPPPEEKREDMRKIVREKFNWESVADRWNTELNLEK